MLTDSSLYEPDGTIIDFDQKAYPIDAWNGAVSSRGDLWGLAAGCLIAERYASFDEFVARSAPEIEREHHDAIRKAMASGRVLGQTMVEIHAIGWSEREDRARAFVLFGGLPEHADLAEFVWTPLEAIEENGMLYMHPSLRGDWRLHRQGAEPGVDFTAESFDPIRHGIPLVEEQRRIPSEAWIGDLAGRYVIGGDVWLTVVDRDGCRQGVIHSWPDEVGAPIDPTPIDESTLPRIVPSFYEGWSFRDFDEAMGRGLIDPETLETRKPPPCPAQAARPAISRQQRRAAEKSARKARPERIRA